MTTTRPTPSAGEREQLRQFVRVVGSMSRRRFVEQLREQDQTLLYGQKFQGPDYDREDFEAFLTDFRKVAISDREPVYLTKILVTVGKFGSERDDYPTDCRPPLPTGY